MKSALGIDPFELCQALYAVSGDEPAAVEILLRAANDDGVIRRSQLGGV